MPIARHVRRIAAATLVAVAVCGPAVARAAPVPLTPSVVGEVPHGAGVFRFPQAVTVAPGGLVAVGDEYSSVIQTFGLDGTPRLTIGSRAARREPGRLGVVGGVAADRAGHLYVLDSENDRVQVFDAATGAHRSSFGDSSIFDLLGGDAADGVGIDASGLAVAQASPGADPIVYVADSGHDRVARFVLSPTTLLPRAAPTLSTPGLGLAAPQGLGLDPAATSLYVADDDNHRIVVLDPVTLAFRAQVGSFGTGPGQFRNPYDVAVDAHDPAQLYVADNLNNRVDVFDASSLAFLTTFGRGAYGPGVGNLEIVRSVGGLADLPGGGVAVADTANNRVQLFDAAGSVAAAWGIAGRGPGYVTRPGAVTFAPDGGITVADTFDHRVELLRADGTYAAQRGLVSTITGYAFAGTATGQYRLPAGVAYDGAGTLWVADTGNDRVVALDATGAVLRTVAGLHAPRGIAAGADGIYVADGDAGRVVRIVGSAVTVVRSGLAHPATVAVTPGGHVLVGDDTSVRDITASTSIAGPSGTTTWDHVSGLAVSSAGVLYASERRPATAGGARVVRGTPAGSAYTWDTVAGEGGGAGQVIEPSGLAVSADGATLLVADTGNDRVLRLDAPGAAVPAPPPELSTGVSPLAGGTVTSDVPGIGCATDCRQHYSAGTVVTLRARPTRGWQVAGWTGACAAAGTAPTCAMTLAGDATATATFVPIPPPPAPVPPTSGPPVAPPAPPFALGRVRVSSHDLRLARRADRRRHVSARRATTVRVTVTANRPATLTVSLLRGRPGRRSGSSCVAPTRALRRARPCMRFVTVPGARTVRAPTTTTAFTLGTVVGGRRLTAGSYRLAITARDAAGDRVGPALVALRVRA